MPGLDTRNTESSIASFGAQSDAYREARPTYPAELYNWIAENAPGHGRALDCATGNGQAAIALSAYFDQVDAFDSHEKQVASAIPAHNVTYQVAQAENTPYADNSFDVITAAQSVHWFDHAKFWPEMKRIAKSDALFCAFGYNRFLSDDFVDDHLVKPVLDVIQPYWSGRNLMVWDGYNPADFQCPFNPITVPPITLTLHWTVARYIAFLESLSATRKARQIPKLNAELDKLLQRFLTQRGGEEKLVLSSRLFTLAIRL